MHGIHFPRSPHQCAPGDSSSKVCGCAHGHLLDETGTAGKHQVHVLGKFELLDEFTSFPRIPVHFDETVVLLHHFVGVLPVLLVPKFYGPRIHSLDEQRGAGLLHAIDFHAEAVIGLCLIEGYLEKHRLAHLHCRLFVFGQFLSLLPRNGVYLRDVHPGLHRRVLEGPTADVDDKSGSGVNCVKGDGAQIARQSNFKDVLVDRRHNGVGDRGRVGGGRSSSSSHFDGLFSGFRVRVGAYWPARHGFAMPRTLKERPEVDLLMHKQKDP
mmetsp:Transcript_6762/g.14720  ORF Transcript_6762/g.14720 Transcript_6762/m.14720 type:complete len:268 (+) Transcript_6762:28-831(+)